MNLTNYIIDTGQITVQQCSEWCVKQHYMHDNQFIWVLIFSCLLYSAQIFIKNEKIKAIFYYSAIAGFYTSALWAVTF